MEIYLTFLNNLENTTCINSEYYNYLRHRLSISMYSKQKINVLEIGLPYNV